MHRRAAAWVLLGSVGLLAAGAAVTVSRPGESRADAVAAQPAADSLDSPVREGPALVDPRDHHVGELIPDVTFTDIDGNAGKLSDYRGRKATVVFMTGTGCPIAKKFVPVIADLAKAYGEKGVAFVAVNPNGHESPDKMRAGAEALGEAVRYVPDADRAIAKALGAMSSTDAFVLDAARTLVYRGAVDDRHGLGYSHAEPRRRFLVDAVDAVLENLPPPEPATTAPGCALDLNDTPAPAAAADVTYHNRISRIMQNRCMECHRDGESAPFELGTYEDVKGQLGMIRKVVRRGVMPPWFADPATGHWANDRSLSAREREDLLAWAAAGAPEGDPADAPVDRAWAQGWRIGKPDQIFEAPEESRIPATGVLGYRHVVIDTGLTEDKWVRAVEVRASAPEVVHHILVFIMFPPDHPRFDEQPRYQGGVRGYFAGLVPNQGATTYPTGVAKFLPRGAKLIFQIHYTPNGTETRDRPKIGLIYADKEPEFELVTRGVANKRFRIPPGHPNYEVSAEHEFAGRARLLSFMPHSHLRGKAFRYELIYPDGKTARVLEVPRYDFNWQLEYKVREPIDVPAGTRLKVTAWYDNSDQNPANPDPTREVKFGDQTWEEMMIGYFSGHLLEPEASAAAAGDEAVPE